MKEDRKDARGFARGARAQKNRVSDPLRPSRDPCALAVLFSFLIEAAGRYDASSGGASTASAVTKADGSATHGGSPGPTIARPAASSSASARFSASKNES